MRSWASLCKVPAASAAGTKKSSVRGCRVWVGIFRYMLPNARASVRSARREQQDLKEKIACGRDALTDSTVVLIDDKTFVVPRHATCLHPRKRNSTPNTCGHARHTAFAPSTRTLRQTRISSWSCATVYADLSWSGRPSGRARAAGCWVDVPSLRSRGGINPEAANLGGTCGRASRPGAHGHGSRR